MKRFIIVLLPWLLIACGSQGPIGPQGPQGPQGPAAPTTTITAEQEDINAVVSDENDYRLSLGQSALTEGLSCTLYTTTGGDSIKTTPDPGHTTLQSLSQKATFLYKGSFNQDDSNTTIGSNILPMALRVVYTNMYMVRCQGQIVVLDTDYHQFDLASDDGSLLYLDNAVTIDNDNNHGIQNKSGWKSLRRGIHVFRLDYAQTGGGNQALILKMDSTVIGGLYFYH